MITGAACTILAVALAAGATSSSNDLPSLLLGISSLVTSLVAVGTLIRAMMRDNGAGHRRRRDRP